MYTEEQKHAYVLGVCARVEVEFTLREIVARIVTERPELILEFAQVWGRLITDEAVAMCHSESPNRYRLTGKRPLPLMELNEGALRETLQGSNADDCAHSILDAVARRQPVQVEMKDGRRVRFTDVSDTLNALRERFGWRPGA